MPDSNLLPKATVNKFFLLQRKKSANKRCVDCNAPSTVWVNLTFSVFICTECAGRHRGIGSDICKIKSTVLDKWDTEELKRVFVGGNLKVKGHLKEDESIKKRYSNRSYVKILDELVEKVNDEDLFIEAEQVVEDKVFENVEIKERAMPKLGVITTDEISYEEKKTTVNNKPVKIDVVKKFQIKTNAFNFEKCNVPIDCKKEDEKRANSESKYSYRNIRVSENKEWTESKGVKSHVKKAVVTASKCSKEIIGNLINKFKK